MKPSVAQARIVDRMGKGAILRWNSAFGRFELREGSSATTVQARTVDALCAIGLIQRDVVGDCMLTRRLSAP